MQPHSQRRISPRTHQQASRQQEKIDSIRLTPGLHDHAAQLADRPRGSRHLRGYGLHLLISLMQSRRLFELERFSRLGSLPCNHLQQGLSGSPQKLPYCHRLCGVPFVCTPLVARRQALLHLRIHTSRKCRVRIQVHHAASQQKQIQHLLQVALSRGLGRKWSDRLLQVSRP